METVSDIETNRSLHCQGANPWGVTDRSLHWQWLFPGQSLTLARAASGHPC